MQFHLLFLGMKVGGSQNRVPVPLKGPELLHGGQNMDNSIQFNYNFTLLVPL